ncbi:hypothetical protein ACQ4PT_058092 [Festuca glaucescens]
MAAAAPARRLLLRLGNSPPLPFPLLSHIAPQLLPHQPPPPAAVAPLPGSPAPSPDPKLRDLLSPSTPPSTYTHPSSTPEEGTMCVREGDGAGWRCGRTA